MDSEQLGCSVPETFAPARVYGGWRMVLDSLCFRQIWPPHTKAAAVSGSVRRLSGVRVTDSEPSAGIQFSEKYQHATS